MNFTAFNTLIEEYNKMRQEFSKKCQEEINVLFQGIFKEFPELNVIKWNQYTPYFNDGEECIFSVNDPIFSNCDPDDENLSSYDYEGDDENVWAMDGYNHDDKSIPKGLPDVYKKLERIIQSDAMADVMKDAFGDHAEITVSRSGIKIEEYSHD